MNAHEKRRVHILRAALACAKRKHYTTITQDEVATKAEVSPALVAYYCGDMDEVRKAVLVQARLDKCIPVLAQATAVADIVFSELSKKTQRALLNYMQG